MSNKLEVSFNSPQCGWMSIGFDDGTREFHTTTAHTPHSQALSEILKGLISLLNAGNAKDEFVVEWSRNPEAYNLRFKRENENVRFEVIEFPTFNRLDSESETVFLYEGNTKDLCLAFAETFNQLYADRETDEFESNWHQPFPFEEYKNFQEKLKIMDDKTRCQSCGMPISKEFGNLGTNADSTFTEEYCSICFADGDFTQPNQTMEEMIESSIENMTGDLNMPHEQAANIANSFIPTLKRWQ